MSEAISTAPKPSENSVKSAPGVSEKLAAASAALFVAVLAVSAYWDPTIRLLHLVEAVPYLLASTLIMARRRHGHMLGVASGAFWLWTGGFLTTFIRNGFERLAGLLQTGHVDRWDILIAVPAAIGTGGLLVFSAVSYIRSGDKSLRDVAAFVGIAAAVAAFFVAIFYVFAPRYLGMFGSLLPGFLKR